jgi:hypothetical protein
MGSRRCPPVRSAREDRRHGDGTVAHVELANPCACPNYSSAVKKNNPIIANMELGSQALSHGGSAPL